MTHVTTSPILCDRCKSPMPVTANLHDDVWVNLILPATVNNVYMLQCLRAVNRKSLDAVDAKVSQLANVIQSHASHKVPVPISLYVSTDELSHSDKAKQAISDWMQARTRVVEARRLDDILRTVDHLNQTAHWANSDATDAQLEQVTDSLLLAMHDLRSVLVRRKADQLLKASRDSAEG